MLFRFLATLFLLTACSVLGMRIEKHNLQAKRKISEQYQYLEELQEQRSQLFLQAQQLGAPPRLVQGSKTDETTMSPELIPSLPHAETEVIPPLLEWRLQNQE